MASEVEFLNRDLALVAKDNSGVLVGRKDKAVMVVCSDRRDAETDRPLILLCKEMDTVDEAVKKQLYLIGKLCRKEPDSKYFGGASEMKNMSNGEFKKHRKMDYIKWAEEMWTELHGGQQENAES